ncbi:hypothetical protein MASR1M6_06080 [Rubrivivax sp.]
MPNPGTKPPQPVQRIDAGIHHVVDALAVQHGKGPDFGVRSCLLPHRNGIPARQAIQPKAAVRSGMTAAAPRGEAKGKT